MLIQLAFRSAILKKGSLTYQGAGVSIEAGADLVDSIKNLVEGTKRCGSTGSIGGFGASFDLKASGYTDPLLVSGTDGVGTKIKVPISVSFIADIFSLIELLIVVIDCAGGWSPRYNRYRLGGHVRQ